jgi:hypothetical protein
VQVFRDLIVHALEVDVLYYFEGEGGISWRVCCVGVKKRGRKKSHFQMT